MERLELLDTSDFETVLGEILREFCEFVGIAAMGECTGTVGEGVLWFDPAQTDLEELVACVGSFDSLPQVDAMTTLKAPSGRPTSIVPNPPGSFAHYMAILSADDAAVTAILSPTHADVSGGCP